MAEHSKRPSATKAGPGRYHQQGRKAEKRPKGTAGAWAGQHKASPEKRERRAAIKAVGRRQYLKAAKAARRVAAEAA